MVARLVVLLALLLAPPAGAQAVPSIPGLSTPAASGTAPPMPQVSPEQAQRLIELLRDDARRTEFIANLEALLAATNTGTAAETPALPIPLAPDSLVGQLLAGAGEAISEITARVVSLARAVSDFPLLWRWIEGLSTDQVAQARIADSSWRLPVVFVIALAAEWLLRRLLIRPRAWARNRATAARGHRGQLHHLPLALLRLGLLLLPVAGFALVAWLLTGGAGRILSTPALPTSRPAVRAAATAYVVARVVLTFVRFILSPHRPSLRLLPASDHTAKRLAQQARRIVAVAATGWAIAEIGLLFGLAAAAYETLLKMIALVVHIYLILIVLQNRHGVAEWIRPRDEAARGAVATLRRRAGDVWHIFAIVYLTAMWAVRALEIPDGYEVLLRLSVMTIAIIIIARSLHVVTRRNIERGFRFGPDLAQRYPWLEARANRYIPALKLLASSAITVAAILALFEAWGFDSLAWLGSGQLGERLLGALGSIGFTMLIALLVWEGSNALIQRHLARLAREAQVVRSARLRTLVPILRTTLVILIGTVTALVVLSEIGVNTAPLLAGAGVVGIAIGFGSQSLVRDVITGLFLLLEDSMQVGDVVELGGLSGLVEALSIRSIRLRAFDGSVHIIPFSAVTTVTNMTRDFSYSVVNVSVGYGEDTDRVGEVLKEIVKEMRAEPRWDAAIRDDLELVGVDQLADSAVVICTRIKTEPLQRWAVAREFNRRIKKRFDELGIEIPYPHMKLIVAGASPTPFASAAPATPGTPTASAAPMPPAAS